MFTYALSWVLFVAMVAYMAIREPEDLKEFIHELRGE